ncbi:tripartite tricarboxylate transporter substrate binding protein [Siccirubricoccus sp. G192]|uniref:Bug family tripartite tricarboxylate transporter substrate binding protein n=1 Tax=Siccirubricoccus sp. G192 TaxID=2849651 RepID=UPI001C2B8983|nr:tripartite tricarboxylate transporter substrate-binding protein [Siccirubricoccus sp. G192]MBV1799772.1 tripartite tricarboxylate transporter substrate binding protein [Siccirubricoccus sp. G192]
MPAPGRRLLLAGLAAPALLRGLPARAQPGPAAQDWPSRPVRMVLPYAAGGPTDIICRLIAERMSQRLPQQVVVENRSGAGGNIGASNIAKSPGDGHHLLFTNIGHAVNRVLYPQLDYDPARDLAPITIVAETPMVLLVPPNSPWHSFAEFIAAVRAAPGRYSYGTSGGGGALQLVSLLLLRAAGLQMTEVPYRGSGPAALDLAAGTLDMMYDAGLTGFALAKGGQGRALALSAAERSPAMPDLPTIAELGFPEAVFSVWQVILAPAATPAPLRARIQREVAAVLAEPALRARLAELGAERLIGNTPAEAEAYVAAEMRRWEVILREAGLPAQ